MDFDGTITMEDTFSGAMRLFVDPGEFSLYSKKLAAGEATLSEVVRRAYDSSIGIGDSFTDCNMARAVDRVFARDVLAEYLEKQKLAYTPFEDFYSIAAAISSSR